LSHKIHDWQALKNKFSIILVLGNYDQIVNDF